MNAPHPAPLPAAAGRPARPARAGTGRPGALASFVRFVVLGGTVGLAASAAVTALATLVPWALANAAVTVASTAAATELHARFTFAGTRSTWRQQMQSAGSAVAAYAVTSAAMAALHACVSAPGVLLAQGVYLSAAALAGLGRFLVLRLVVFAAGRTGPGPRRTPPPTTPPTPAAPAGPAGPAAPVTSAASAERPTTHVPRARRSRPGPPLP
ncbi:hypothetical protein [Streptomyces longwoodensis]|uniref:hypothetical protein n=1 Tax=Streptomyces longwoodensis TaxID=68231 RepID=UPI003F54103F